MSENFSFKDYIKFFYQKKMTIIVTAVICLLAFLGFYLLENSNNSIEKQNEVVETQFDQKEIDELIGMDFDLLSEEQQGTLSEYLSQKAYAFNIYIELGDNTPFVNNELLKKILTSKDILTEVENIANTSITPNPNIGLVVSEEYGDILSVRVGTGDEAANRAISNAYYSLISNNEINFLTDKDIYFFEDEPVLVEEIEPENELVDSELEGTVESNNSLVTTIIMSIVVVVGGLILGVIIALLSRLLSMTISFLYDYNLRNNDKLIKFYTSSLDVDKNLQNKLNHLLFNNINKEKIVITNDEKIRNYINITIKYNENFKSLIKVIPDLADVDPINHIDEAILITVVNKTTKKWYKNQKLLLNNYSVPIKVIQFSK